jgi:hypothetical protein
MKTTTKVLLGSLGLIVFLFISFSFVQSDGKSYLIVRTQESAMGDTKLIIVYENGKTEEQEIGRMKEFIPNAVKINQVFNKLGAQGYELVSSTGGDILSTFTFVKR